MSKQNKENLESMIDKIKKIISLRTSNNFLFICFDKPAPVPAPMITPDPAPFLEVVGAYHVISRLWGQR